MNSLIVHHKSTVLCAQIVQEYERAVIFRLGRIVPGGAKGPGRTIDITAWMISGGCVDIEITSLISLSIFAKIRILTAELSFLHYYEVGLFSQLNKNVSRR